MQTAPQPVFEDVLAAAARIAPPAHATPVLRSRGIAAIAGCSLHFKAEPLPRAGTFKFLCSCNAGASLDDPAPARLVRSEERLVVTSYVCTRRSLSSPCPSILNTP